MLVPCRHVDGPHEQDSCCVEGHAHPPNPPCRHAGERTAAVPAAAVQQWRDSPDGTKWGDLLEDLDCAIAERRCGEALQLLRRAEKAAARPADGGREGAAGLEQQSR